MTLQTITHCGATYMVGLNGMSTEGVGSGGKGYCAFGNDELTRPVSAVPSPCPICGVLVPVESITGKMVTDQGGEA